MPVGLSAPVQADPDALDEGASTPISAWSSYQQSFADATHHFTAWALNALQGNPSDISSRFGQAYDEQRLDPETANQRYGIDGALRFNAPVMEADAAFRHQEKREEQWSQILQARTNANPLMTMGAQMAGSLLDPMGLALMAGTDGFGKIGEGLLDLGVGAEGAAASARSGLIANGLSHGGELMRTALEGGIANAPFVGLDAARSQDLGDDYTMGNALQDLALGSIFHTGLHYGGKLFEHINQPRNRAEGETASSGAAEEDMAATPLASAAPSLPDDVAALPEGSRMAAFLKATDDLSDDRAVDVGQYVQREAAPPSLDDLTERDAAPQIPGRWLNDDVAITPRGEEFPVRYGLAEMGDLVTSHDDDFNVNPAYPSELQPRDRSLVGAAARNLNLENDLNPKLLMSDVNAAGGAPVIAPNGVVESGNGRTIALRRSLAQGRTDAYARYRAALEAAGYDTTGMQAPVLVRARTEPMTGARRATLARDMNADVTERMSAPEQALADARRISEDDLANAENPLNDRAFQRAFLEKVAPDQINQLVDARGNLSDQGRDRLQRAVAVRAFDSGAEDLRVGRAAGGGSGRESALEGLVAAAPAWSRMRAMAIRGDIPADLDLTANLNSALDLVRAAKADGQALGSFLAERFGQLDAFSGDAIAPETEAFLRILYRDEAFSKPREPARIAWALNDYARQAMAVTPGPDLFGDAADASTARQILANIEDRFARQDAGRIDLRAPGRAAEPADGEEPAAGASLIDLRQPGGERPEGGGQGLRPGDEPGAGDEGDGSRNDPGATAGRSPPAGVKVRPVSVRDHYKGETFGSKVVEKDGKEVARADINLLGDEVFVQNIEVPDAARRQGYARALVNDLFKEFPGKKIFTSAMTDDGHAFFSKNYDIGENSEITPKSTGALEDSKPPAAESLISADPDLKAVQTDTARLAAEHGLQEDEPPENQQPDNLVKALHAAATCLIDAAGEVFGG